VFTHDHPDRIAGKLMHCFFMRGGHIAAVEVLPGLQDAEAVAKSLDCSKLEKMNRALKDSRSGIRRAW
jgi:hypothetical protein